MLYNPRIRPVSVGCLPVVAFNPVLLVEVLSPSTADFDRGGKFDHYRQIRSLREYVLIWQDQVRVEQRVKNDTGWQLHDIIGIESQVDLVSIDGNIALADIYDKVNFSDDA